MEHELNNTHVSMKRVGGRPQEHATRLSCCHIARRCEHQGSRIDILEG